MDTVLYLFLCTCRSVILSYIGGAGAIAGASGMRTQTTLDSAIATDTEEEEEEGKEEEEEEEGGGRAGQGQEGDKERGKEKGKTVHQYKSASHPHRRHPSTTPQLDEQHRGQQHVPLSSSSTSSS